MAVPRSAAKDAELLWSRARSRCSADARRRLRDRRPRHCQIVVTILSAAPLQEAWGSPRGDSGVKMLWPLIYPCCSLLMVDADLAPSAEQATAQGPRWPAHFHPPGWPPRGHRLLLANLRALGLGDVLGSGVRSGAHQTPEAVNDDDVATVQPRGPGRHGAGRAGGVPERMPGDPGASARAGADRGDRRRAGLACRPLLRSHGRDTIRRSHRRADTVNDRQHRNQRGHGEGQGEQGRERGCAVVNADAGRARPAWQTAQPRRSQGWVEVIAGRGPDPGGGAGGRGPAARGGRTRARRASGGVAPLGRASLASMGGSRLARGA
jgi:hypothetical protein